MQLLRYGTSTSDASAKPCKRGLLSPYLILFVDDFLRFCSCVYVLLASPLVTFGSHYVIELCTPLQVEFYIEHFMYVSIVLSGTSFANIAGYARYLIFLL